VIDRLRRVVTGPRGRGRATALLLASLVIVVGCASAASAPNAAPPATQAPLGVRETAYDPPRPAPPLVLTDQDGRSFDLASLRGRPVLVYFGYAHCPDVCPATLADVRDALELVDGPVGVVFVTVDPARDDAAAIRQYVGYYGADFVGLTGTEEAIAAAAADWGVSYTRLESESAAGYAMAHSTDTYLVDADGTLRHHLFFGASPELIAERIRDVAG